MKKTLLAILVLAYLCASTGITLRSHYCMSMRAVSNGTHMSKGCGEMAGKMPDVANKGCCRNESKWVKNDTDQQSPETGFQIKPPVASGLSLSFIETGLHNAFSAPRINPLSHAPPLHWRVPLYIRNRILLI